MPLDDEVEQLARIRMQVTGETFEQALAALQGQGEGEDGTDEAEAAAPGQTDEGGRDDPEPPDDGRRFRVVE
ncbi:hypothetical protein [Streptomyces sp. 8N706]|uniref:hypothetical protein n=1 Tax=Streptomyces sp. 8N706 TaxID=3457416 RepID=UPI003FCF2D46